MGGSGSLEGHCLGSRQTDGGAAGGRRPLPAVPLLGRLRRRHQPEKHRPVGAQGAGTEKSCERGLAGSGDCLSDHPAGSILRTDQTDENCESGAYQLIRANPILCVPPRGPAGEPACRQADSLLRPAVGRPDRDAAKLSKSIHDWLSELAKRVPCAIVSGRARSDLIPRVNGAVPYLIGNHGLESPLTPPAALSLAENVCLAWMERVETDLAQALKAAGIEDENKRYSLGRNSRIVCRTNWQGHHIFSHSRKT
ncbi:MAG: hypothetical protein CAF45_015995 [Nitrospira sp. CG24E]|nr:MAG: hypothetical protein CAF45_015995 [Nitrospira sp. CG24E]